VIIQDQHSDHDAEVLDTHLLYQVWNYFDGSMDYGRVDFLKFLKENLVSGKLDLRVENGVLRSRVCVYRSQIRPLNEGGGVVYEELTPNPMDQSGWTSTVMGQIARHWYCGWTAPVGQEISAEKMPR
jgi:hypothetical protein